MGIRSYLSFDSRAFYPDRESTARRTPSQVLDRGHVGSNQASARVSVADALPPSLASARGGGHINRDKSSWCRSAAGVNRARRADGQVKSIPPLRDERCKLLDAEC